MDGAPPTFSSAMTAVRQILLSLVLLLALTGLAVSGAQATAMMPDQPVAMVDGGMNGGMLDCDGCKGDEGSLAVCMIFCGSSCAGDLTQAPGRSEGGLVASRAVIVPAAILPPGAAIALEPPRPKTHSL